ncbi:MAG: 2Fe-2S iron-sulfur cluster-binding protein [Candidatus Gracilibacteria bacterium]|jgi:ferredoxin
MPKVKNLTTGASAECEKGADFKEVAQKNNLGVAFGCESGICCTCLIRIKSGAENLSPKTEQEEFTLEARMAEPNMRLGCQCKINGDTEFGL